ncbi:hypothetical protein [Pedobacter cryotolerans]|uniref:HEAT repeat domain-containing protein n=1 Tax=Pedobacter cryotolerans TaxID=2571270 RepID=A0A4U1CA24_9SPHI|nr:hypothetical protein [Pedobacter cryotolerans]TKC01299.1 hypothetical protein FA045_08655 [Pedobacter cryotolerans]
MHSEILLVTLANAIAKKKVIELTAIALENDELFEQLLEFSFHPKPEVTFRAAWILENIYLANPQKFIPHLNWFLINFPQQQNSSARRNFAKILALITKKNAQKEIKEIVQQFKTDDIVETVFAWLIDDEVAVAIKSHCLNILANLSTKHNWIKDELLQTMNFLVDKESIAFYAKVKQIKKQLK